MSEHFHGVRPQDVLISRREALRRMGNGFAALSFAGLLAEEARASVPAHYHNPLAAHEPPLPATAKRVIFIFLNGGPSHVDMFDPKPLLNKHHGQLLPYTNLATERKTGTAFGSPFKFSRHGQCGTEISELFPHLAEHVDEIAFIRSMHADVPNHEPSLSLMNCGDGRLLRPSLGSWTLYGLGTQNQNLPGFVAMCPNGYPIQDTQNWQSAFLPGIYQGTYIDPSNPDIHKIIDNLRNGLESPSEQRADLDLAQALNRIHHEARDDDARLDARIQSFELAFRMQTEATDAFDVGQEPAAVRAMYGDGTYARQLLIARRLLERGVRYVQVYQGAGQPWDLHDDLKQGMINLGHQADQPIAALLTDLRQRGMLKDTLVICGGEFGRTPTVELPQAGSNQGRLNGRDHNHYGFTVWLAGGGVRGGQAYGATDDFGFKAEEKPVHVHDLHATVLRLLGFDHTKLTYRYAGRDFRLTDVYGTIVQDLIA